MPELRAERSVPTLHRLLAVLAVVEYIRDGQKQKSPEVIVATEKRLTHFLRHLRLPKTRIAHQKKHELQQT